MRDWPLWYDRDGNPISQAEANRLLGEERHIASTDVGWLWVSTVHLVLNHRWDGGPPLIFETMVFPALGASMLDDYCERTSTKEAALAAHDQAVEWAKRHQSLRDEEDSPGRHAEAEDS